MRQNQNNGYRKLVKETLLLQIQHIARQHVGFKRDVKKPTKNLAPSAVDKIRKIWIVNFFI